MALWTASTFKTEYGLSVADGVLTPALTRAEYRIKAYITDAAYTNAIAQTPSDAAQASLVKYVVSDVALFYLQHQNLAPPSSRTRYSESYAGVKKYEESYATNKSTTLTFTEQEEEILKRLWEIARSPDQFIDISPAIHWGDAKWQEYIYLSELDDWEAPTGT